MGKFVKWILETVVSLKGGIVMTRGKVDAAFSIDF